MDCLLDTQAIIWFIDGDMRLPQKVRDTVKDPENSVSITVVSLWEIAIKRSLEKLKLATSLSDIQHQVVTKKVSILPLTVAHLETLENLAYKEKHRDPFDRLIISQAITKNMTLISSDSHFKEYSVQTLW